MSSASRAGRVRRQDGETVNERLQLTIYIGFILDGVTTFRNLSGITENTLTIYIDPIIHIFKEDDQIRIYRPFSPFNDAFLDMRVSVHSQPL